MFQYYCIVRKIVDGDTVDADIDLGFDVWLHNKRIRFYGIDAPESRTKDLQEKEQGLAAKEYVATYLPVGSKQILLSKKFETGKYGRILGDFLVYDPIYDAETCLTELMIRDNHAIPYMT